MLKRLLIAGLLLLFFIDSTALAAKRKKKRRNNQPSYQTEDVQYQDDEESYSPAPPPNAGQQHIFDGREHMYGFVISGEIMSSKLIDVKAGLEGVSCALLIDHRKTLGLGAFRVGAPVEYKIEDETFKLNMYYGGFEMGYIGAWKEVVNTRLSIFIGRGQIDLDYEGDTPAKYRVTGLTVAEPAVGFYVNLLDTLKLGFDTTYRWVSTDEALVRGNKLSGVSFAVALRGGLL